MELCNEKSVCSDDVLLFYNNLIDVNCENVEKVTVNCLIPLKFDDLLIKVWELRMKIASTDLKSRFFFCIKETKSNIKLTKNFFSFHLSSRRTK